MKVRSTKEKKYKGRRTKGEKVDGKEMGERLVGDFFVPGKGAEGTTCKAGKEKAGCAPRKFRKVSDPLSSLKHGRPTLSPKPLKGKYRELMRTKFEKKTYGQRWQVETVFSMIKRNFGDTINARSYQAQCREMMLLVMTHNIAVILFVKQLFYRAGLTLLVPVFPPVFPKLAEILLAL